MNIEQRRDSAEAIDDIQQDLNNFCSFGDQHTSDTPQDGDSELQVEYLEINDNIDEFSGE